MILVKRDCKIGPKLTPYCGLSSQVLFHCIFLGKYLFNENARPGDLSTKGPLASPRMILGCTAHET